VLADTTYNPLSIDEVAAAHVNADCVVRVPSHCCSRLDLRFVFSCCLCTQHRLTDIAPAHTAHLHSSCKRSHTQIHYGHASLTPVTRTPALCVLPRSPLALDAPACAQHMAAALVEHGGSGGGSGAEGDGSSGSSGGWALVTFDQSYAHEVPQLKSVLAEAYQVRVCGDIAAERG
jgi:diphthamide biosynthesis protein 2